MHSEMKPGRRFRTGAFQRALIITLIDYNGKLILFDGGSSADILQYNAEVLGVDLAKVDIAVLSHSHVDHLSGLDYLLQIKLYLPSDPTIGGWPTKDAEEAAWNKRYQRGYRFRDANVTYVKENMQIAPEIALIATTSPVIGEFSKYPPHDKDPLFKGLPEVALALQTPDGQWALVVGCSHSQVENIVRETKKYLEKNVAGVAGGFHQLPYPSAIFPILQKC